MRFYLLFLQLLLLHSVGVAGEETIVFIGHSGLPKTDLSTLQRVYTGRVISIARQEVLPLNYPPGDPLREQFLEVVMRQSEEQYAGYWLVRKYVGKGAPPVEFATMDALIKYVTSTPGAIGYLPASKVPMGANIIFKP